MAEKLKFCDLEGAQTPTRINGYMKLGDNDYIDHLGVEHEQNPPEGYLKADHICWNGTLEHVNELIASLEEGKRYNVLIHERKG